MNHNADFGKVLAALDWENWSSLRRVMQVSQLSEDVCRAALVEAVNGKYAEVREIKKQAMWRKRTLPPRE